jgi:hypothetical protein
MKQVQLIRLFVACPGDILDEHSIIDRRIDEINRTSGRHLRFKVERLSWKKDTYGGMAEYAQAVINEQIDYEIIVGIFWKRIGTTTPNFVSGTVEELENAFILKKKFLIYFSNVFTNPDTIDGKQLDAVHSYKGDLDAKGILYKPYDSIEYFGSLFTINLQQLIFNNILESASGLESKPQEKYTTVASLINFIEQKEKNVETVEDAINILNKLLLSINLMSDSLIQMAQIKHEMNIFLNKKGDELNKNNYIKDNRLRISRGNLIVKSVASQFGEYTNKINNILPSFSENFLQIGPLYSRIALFFKKYNVPVEQAFFDNFRELRNQSEKSMNSEAMVLQRLTELTEVNSKLRIAKKEIEIVIKNSTKILHDGLVLLDEAEKTNSAYL